MASNCQYLWFSSSSDAKCHKDHVPEKGNNMVKVYCRNVFTDVAIAVTQWTKLTFSLQQWTYWWCLQRSDEVERSRDEKWFTLTSHASIHGWLHSKSRFSDESQWILKWHQEVTSGSCTFSKLAGQFLKSGRRCGKVPMKYWLNIDDQMMLTSTEKPLGSWLSIAKSDCM